MRETTRGDVTALPLIDIATACALLQRSRATVDKWIRAGKLQAFTLPATAKAKGGKRYLVQREVEALAAAAGRPPPEKP